jgi:UDP-N-acetylmuramate--alanine ligase
MNTRKSISNFKNKKFHFINIGGLSMRSLAAILLRDGNYIQGSDLKILPHMEGAHCYIFNKENKAPLEKIKEMDYVVYNTLVQDDHPERKMAVRNKIPLIHRADLLRDITQNRFKYLITGTAGKTSTTHYLNVLLKLLNKDPFGLVAARLKDNANYEDGEGPFVVEHNEGDLFLSVDKADCIIFNNVYYDHIWDFKNDKEFFKNQYLKLLNEAQFIIYNEDDAEASKYIKEVNNNVKITKVSKIFYGQEHFQILNIEDDVSGVSWQILYENKIYKVKSFLHGEFSAYNVTEAIAAIVKTQDVIIENVIHAVESLTHVESRIENIFTNEHMKAYNCRFGSWVSVEANVQAMKKYHLPISIIFSTTRLRGQHFFNEINNFVKQYRCATLNKEFANDNVCFISNQEDFNNFFKNTHGILMLFHCRHELDEFFSEFKKSI